MVTIYYSKWSSLGRSRTLLIIRVQLVTGPECLVYVIRGYIPYLVHAAFHDCSPMIYPVLINPFLHISATFKTVHSSTHSGSCYYVQNVAVLSTVEYRYVSASDIPPAREYKR
jgi:hypothetical protein